MAALKAHIAQKNIKMAGEPPAAPSLKASDEGVEVSCPIGNGEEQESDGVECKSTSGNRLSSDSVDLSNFNTTDVSVQVNHGTTTSKPINTPSRCMRWIRRARMVLRRGSNGYEVAPNASHEPCEEEKGNDNLVEKDNVIILPSSIATATEWECYFQAVWIRRQWRVSLMLVFSFVTFAGAAIFYYSFALCLIFFGIVTFAMMLLENRRANGDLSLPPDIVFDRCSMVGAACILWMFFLTFASTHFNGTVVPHGKTIRSISRYKFVSAWKRTAMAMCKTRKATMPRCTPSLVHGIQKMAS